VLSLASPPIICCVELQLEALDPHLFSYTWDPKNIIFFSVFFDINTRAAPHVSLMAAAFSLQQFPDVFFARLEE
jgi:hypothetical protein